MRLSKELFSLSLVGLALTFSAQLPALSADKTQADELTKQASELSEAGKLDEAIELENKAAKSAPNYWAPHAALSYLNWRKAMLQEAFGEGETAIKLAPTNAFALLNYAELHQLMGSLDDAIPLYTKAGKLAPDNWIPFICKAQCLIMTAHVPEATKVLDEMLAAKTRSFDWWYQLSDTYMKISNFKDAQQASEKALLAAKTDEQRKSTLTQLYVVAIQAGDLTRAGALQKEVLATKPSDEQVYTLTQAHLIKPDAPQEGQALIDCAKASEIFSSPFYYSMGKAFEEKAGTPGLDKASADKWLESAEAAYRIAVKYGPAEAKNHLAIAEMMDRAGKHDEMLAELEKAKEAEDDEPLAPYLVSKIKPAEPKLASYKLNLTSAVMTSENLHCACKLPALMALLKSTPGVAFAGSEKTVQPFKVIVMVDQSTITLNDLVHKIAEGTKLNFDIASSEKITTVSDAVNVAKRVTDINKISMSYSFKQNPPRMPLM
jgi:tetratricopeptide (TPR) repeat protein